MGAPKTRYPGKNGISDSRTIPDKGVSGGVFLCKFDIEPEAGSIMVSEFQWKTGPKRLCDKSHI